MDWITDISIKHPWFLLLWLLIPLYFYWIHRKNQPEGINISTLAAFDSSDLKKTKIWIITSHILKSLCIVFLVTALARPQIPLRNKNVFADVRDIMLVMDLSGSMNEKFQSDETKLEITKRVAAQFVGNREYDRMGLVIFGTDAYTLCPLTTDRQILVRFIENLRIDDRFGRSTNIGLGLGTGVNRIKDTEAISKAIIFLTDGVDNGKDISPEEVAKLAKKLGVKVYTIALGSQEVVTSFDPLFGKFEKKVLDISLLKKISSITEGQFFLGVNEETLKSVFESIDSLETTKVEVSKTIRYAEEFRWFLIIGLIFLSLDIILRWTKLKTLPA